MNQKRIMELEKACAEMRLDILRMGKAAGNAGLHFGGSLSMVEILASLYLEVMNISKSTLCAEERDRFILSKGHGVPAVYAVLKQMGILQDNDLDSFKTDSTRLYAHPSMNPDMGIEFSSGSLGQGLSLGVGTAIALKRKKNYSSRVYVLLGDGECDEGMIWEAAMSASHFALDNLVAIVDRNGLQYDGNTENIMGLESLSDKWKSFGWYVIEINGHSIEECCNAFQTHSDKPIVIIANTIKGKGISFMENDPSWHHKTLSKEQQMLAIEEILDHARV